MSLSLLTRGRAKTPTGEPSPAYDPKLYAPQIEYRIRKRVKPVITWRDSVETLLATLSAIGWGSLMVCLFSITIYSEVTLAAFVVANIILVVVSIAKRVIGDTWLIGSPIELLFV